MAATEFWSPVLVGRERELAALREAIASPPALVVVDGEAGIGKSRLVSEAVNGGRPLVGHCEPLRDPLPLGPLLDAVRAARLDPPLNPIVGALAPLLPELADRLPPAPPPLSDPRTERHRVFRAAIEVLAHIAPATLVLEDLHWADRGTFDFLAFLATHQPAGLSVVLTARTEAGDLPIREALARAPAGPAVRLSLAPLERGEVRELAERILRAGVSEAFAATLYEKTSGIPFVVEEVLRTLPAGGDEAALRAVAVPTALRDVVLTRLDAVDEEAREVLGAAAVLGTAPDERALAAMVDREPATIADALGRAQAAGLLVEREGGPRFRHALAHQIVYEAVPAPRRRWLHVRAADVLEPAGDPALLAHHYRRAGRTEEFVRSAEAAADVAVGHGHDAAAARFLMEAMEAPDLALGVRVRLAVKLGRAAVDGLAQSEAMPLLERLLREPLPAAARGELRFALGRLLRQQGEARAGYLEIERAVPDLEDRPALLGRALAILSAPETVPDRHVREHAARCEEAERAAARSGDHRVEIAVRIARASLLLETGDPRSWELVEDLLRDEVLLAAPREHARACLNWAQGALHTGHVTRAEALLAEGRGVIERTEYLRLAGVVELIGAAVDRAAGRWKGLEGRARRLAQQPAPFAAALLDARFLHGVLLGAVGGADEARATLRAVIDTAEQVGAVWPLIPARTALSRLLLTLGDAEAAAAEARAGLDAVRAKGNWVWGAETVLCLLDAVGESDELRRLVDELETSVRAADAPLARAALLSCQATVAADESLLEAAVEQVAALPYERAQAAERLGGWRCERGRDGAEPLTAALRLYGELGASRDIARVRRTMRRHGLPVPYPWRGGRRAYGDDLSPREREVALLAARGRTNQEIAEELFLSRRTVESHVASALRKLGARSRRELGERMS